MSANEQPTGSTQPREPILRALQTSSDEAPLNRPSRFGRVGQRAPVGFGR